MLVDALLRDPSIRQGLAAHYRHGIDQAVAAYEDSAADEDSVTGALGQALRGSGDVLTSNGRPIRWCTRYRKLRGRGKNAPEKALGADGLFEIELQDLGAREKGPGYARQKRPTAVARTKARGATCTTTAQ